MIMKGKHTTILCALIVTVGLVNLTPPAPAFRPIKFAPPSIACSRSSETRH